MIYLDNAATSFPKPECVYQALDRFARQSLANPGRAGHKMALAAERALDDGRHLLNQFFHGEGPERFVFTLNCTDALNMAFKGVLADGDHVVTTDLEHNSVSRPLVALERAGRIALTRVPADATDRTAEQQARSMLFRTRDLLVHQRTQLINALRGQLSEHGVVAPQGPANVAILAQAIDDMTPSLPLLVVELARVYLDQIDGLSEKVAGLEKAIACEAKRGAMTRRLQTMPGVGPITAMAIETFAPPMEVFRRGRDFAAWLGLVPVQHSTGGKQVLGKISKMGQRDIRRLLITGAMVIVRWACRKGAQEGTWLHRMLRRKPRMLVAIALANKMARSIWAMLTKGEDYRGPVAATL